MTDITIPFYCDDFDDKHTWYRSTRKTTKPKSPKFPPDKDINLWLKQNGPHSYQQLADIRYVLYHRCSRSHFLVSKKTDEGFTLAGRKGSLTIVNNEARHYLLWKLRLLGRKKRWIGALPRTKRPGSMAI